MPGVPSSRGCDACRKQKKKCDQAEPTCARCQRLGIQCAGGGRQRFKFINASPPSPPSLPSPPEGQGTENNEAGGTKSTGVIVPMPRCSGPVVALRHGTRVRDIFLAPSNHDTYLRSRLVSWLKIRDARYDSLVFGSFLTMMPSRVGRSPALDTALEAFYHSHVEDGFNEASLVSVRKHGRALRALRSELIAGNEVTRTELMIAVYLTLVTESKISSTSEKRANHAVILARMLEVYADKPWPTSFESGVAITLYITVLIDALGDCRLSLEPWASTILDRLFPRVAGPQPPEIMAPYKPKRRWPSLHVRHLTHMVHLARDPANRFDEIQAAYDLVAVDVGVLRDFVCGPPPGSIVPITETREFDNLPDRRLRVGLCSQLTMGLIFGMLFNHMLQEYDSYTSDSSKTATLRLEMESYVDAMGVVAVLAVPERPLGSNYAPPGLCAAWVATRDAERRARMRRLMADFERGFDTVSWAAGMEFWEKKVHHIKLAVRKTRGEDVGDELREVEQMLWENPCHMQ